MDRIELIEAYREIIKENIEYDLLVLRYGRERLDEALELMLEVILFLNALTFALPEMIFRGRSSRAGS